MEKLEALVDEIAVAGGRAIAYPADLSRVETIAALQPGASCWSTYQGSQSGFGMWFRAVATELRPSDITASSVCLLLARTRMSAPVRFDAKVPALTPDQAAQVLAHAVVTRGVGIAPSWLWWCQLGTLLARTPVDRALTALDRRAP